MTAYIDIHTHILPAMDDGPKSWEDAIQMCRIAVDDGIKTIVLTPHIHKGVYWFKNTEISEKANQLKKHLKEHDIPLDITTGADVHLGPETMPLIKKGIYSINPGKKYVLVEFPDENIPQKIEDNIFNLLIQGITPILTHPERNHEIQRNPQKLFELVSRGLYTQVTSSSITGGFGIKARKTVEILVRHRLAHIIASDAHSPNWRPPVLGEAVKTASEYADKDFILDMVTTYPEAIINGKEIMPPEPVEIKKPKNKTFAYLNKLFSAAFPLQFPKGDRS